MLGYFDIIFAMDYYQKHDFPLGEQASSGKLFPCIFLKYIINSFNWHQVCCFDEFNFCKVRVLGILVSLHGGATIVNVTFVISILQFNIAENQALLTNFYKGKTGSC
ncbi:MAG: hypothetical protein ABIN89_25630 [Chitinophagaceae bacterium]